MQKLNEIVYEYFRNKTPFTKHNYVLQMTSNIEYFQALRIQCQVALGDAKADTHYL